jgi:hypothetical protein
MIASDEHALPLRPDDTTDAPHIRDWNGRIVQLPIRRPTIIQQAFATEWDSMRAIKASLLLQYLSLTSRTVIGVYATA